MVRLIRILLMLLVASSAWGAALRFGMTAEEVETAIGKPTSRLERAGSLIWLYPDGGRVEIFQGKVVSITNLSIAGVKNLAAEKVAEVKEEPPAVTSDVPPEFEGLGKDDPTKVIGNAPGMGLALSAVTDKWQSQLDDHTDDSVRVWGGLVIRAFLGMLVTMGVLKVAFMWADVYTEWSQLLVPAAVDMVTRSGVASLALVFWGNGNLYFADDAIAFFAMLFALQKFTHASTLARAVSVALAAKFASIFVWSMLSVVLLRAVT
jgi:hypothetical protein